METSAAATSNFSLILTIVAITGFVAAASIGSIAWFNSKKPTGWKNEQKPDIVPEIDKN